jgi:DNA-directed RNA polymerase subunit M/transcription elongation factor TFIIS
MSDNANKLSMKPCPICQEMMIVIGNDGKKKLTSCGHKFHFKQTRSQKEMSRKYIETPWGLELVKE